MVVSLLLSFKSSLYILDNSLLTDMSFANTFSQCMIFHLIYLTMSLGAGIFNFNELQPINNLDVYFVLYINVITIPKVI